MQLMIGGLCGFFAIISNCVPFKFMIFILSFHLGVYFLCSNYWIYFLLTQCALAAIVISAVIGLVGNSKIRLVAIEDIY